MYTVFNTETKTLTFKYGSKQGDTDTKKEYDVPTDPKTYPRWLATYSKSITTVDFDRSFLEARPTSCAYWFDNCSKLTSIKNIKYLNTANVKNMSNMFNYCQQLTSLDLSNFNTANVTDMSSMFGYCEVLTTLDVSKFNTANVTHMTFMFSGCSGLTSLDLSSFITANVTNMSNMFCDCSGLKSLNLSNFNTANVENMISMFNGCSGLENLDLSSFNTANVTTMGSMFYNCQKLTSLNVSKFNTENVTNMSLMFGHCSQLSSLDLSSFNTAKVREMSYMFSGCSGLSSLDLSSFNTAKVGYMNYMFNGCSGLNSLNLSSFKTANVTNMNYMFNGCSDLKKIYVSDDFKTGNVSSSDKMFSGCSQLVGAVSYNSGKTGIDRANYNTGYFKTYFTLGDSKVELCGKSLTTNSLNLDLSGEKDFVAHAPFTANMVTYTRDLSSSTSTWFSLCLPFAYTPNNFTAYQLMSATANAVEIEEIKGEIVAGTPVLFKFKDGAVDKTINLSATDAQIVKAPVEGAKVTGPDGSLQLCGTYQNKSFSEEDRNAFILLNNQLMNPAKMLENENVKKVGVNPFRAYMTLTASAQTSSARAFSIGHGGEGNEGTTAIDLLNSVATDDAEYYDINGRRIDAPAKGVNIVRRGNKTIKLIIK